MIGKKNHVASMMDEFGKVVFKTFFPHTLLMAEEAFFSKLSSYSSDTASFEIGMEATGHYWLTVYSFLYEKGFVQYIINPVQTDGWRKGTEIHMRKNDTIGSVIITDLIHYRQFVETNLAGEDLFSLRNLTRFHSYFTGSVGGLKRKIVYILYQVFPEYQPVFLDISGKTSKEILMQFLSPMYFEEIPSETLAGLLWQKIGNEKAGLLKDAARHSFGITFAQDSFTFQLKALLSQISFIEDQIRNTDAETASIMEKLASPVTTITGICKVTGAAIISEICDISKFNSPKKLTPYASLDASASKFGEFEATHNVMSKRGSPYLCKAIFQAALVAYFKDPVLSAFYEKKWAEGKHHLTCVGAVSRKMCNIIYAVLKGEQPYLPKA